MRRIMLVVTVALVIAAMMGVGALPVAAQGDGAEIFRTSCHASAALSPYPLVTITRTVITPEGTTELICQFKGPAIEETIVAEGFRCNTYLGTTTQSRFIYTKSGHATLICLVNPGGSEST